MKFFKIILIIWIVGFVLIFLFGILSTSVRMEGTKGVAHIAKMLT